MTQMQGKSPDELLFTDKAGTRQQLQDVIYEGLDDDYSDRYPALVELIASGTPAHRLYAATMLASWGQPAGLRAITAWANQPQAAPWAASPVTFERFSGADAAFSMLADAIRVAGDLEGRTPEVDGLRDEATRALLAIYDRVAFERTLMVALDLDVPLSTRLAPEIAAAVDRTVAAAKAPAGFDLATQAASLIAILAKLDDVHAARAAEALLAAAPTNQRAAREVAYAMRFGNDATTRALLDRLCNSPDPALRDEARESRKLREAS